MKSNLQPAYTSRLEAYKRMYFIRAAQEELAQLYLNKKIFSMVHFYIGQEAVATGVCDAIGKNDKVLGNHRSHGHYLAKGGNFRNMVCELLGRAAGSAKGKGGSMHMIDRSVNFIGSTPLLGSVAPIASGVAFEQKYNSHDGITVAFFGDGASEEGVVYETYNLAALYKVPLLLVIENNTFSINSKMKDRRSGGYDVRKIVEGLGMRYEMADGTDYHDVHSKALALVQSIRSGQGPAVLECHTHRHMAHSTPLMEEGYRGVDTAEHRLKQDAVRKMREQVRADGMSEKAIISIERSIRSSILKDIRFALRAPFPAKKELYTHMYEK